MNDFTEFAKPLDTYVEDFAERQQESAEAIGETNFSIHEQRLGRPSDFPRHQEIPHCLYFSYLKVKDNGGLDVRHYFYPGGEHNNPDDPPNASDWPVIPNNNAALIPILQDLIENARAEGSDFPLIGSSFQGTEWFRKSYIALFIDEENWSLYQDTATELAAILFVTDPRDGRYGTPNHSFFDGRNLAVPLPDGQLGSAFVCINHMKRDADGEDLQNGEIQRYVYKLFFRVRFADNAPPLTVIWDPDGNNLGPPLPPP